MATTSAPSALKCAAISLLYLAVQVQAGPATVGVRGRISAPATHFATSNCRSIRNLIAPRSMALSESSQKRKESLDLPSVDVDPQKGMLYQITDNVPQLGEKYAVVEVGGSQVIVEEGRWYTVNRLKANVGDIIRLPRVLLMKMGEDKIQLGLPYIEDGIVEAQVVEHLRGEKLRAGKYKPKKHYRRTWGVRDELTKFVVTKIHTDSSDFIPTVEA